MHSSNPSRMKFQHAAKDAQAGVGGNDVNVVGLDPEIVRHLEHRHRRDSPQDVCERTFVLRIEMLHEHEAQPRRVWQALQQSREGL